MMSKYSEEITLGHNIAKQHEDCVQLIDAICCQESFHQNEIEPRCSDFDKIKFGDAKAINLDDVMKKQNPRPNSVDMVIGLENKKYIGVELKLCVKRPPDGNTTELKDKKTDSMKELQLQNMDFILIYCKSNKAINYFEKIKRGSKPEHGYEMMFLEDFKEKYF